VHIVGLMLWISYR